MGVTKVSRITIQCNAILHISLSVLWDTSSDRFHRWLYFSLLGLPSIFARKSSSLYTSQNIETDTQLSWTEMFPWRHLLPHKEF